MSQRRPYDTRRRDAQKRATRDAIVGAARELFAKQGYVNTTIAEIADAAEVSVPTVYAQFGTKAALVKVLLDVAIAGDQEPLPIAQRPFFTRIYEPGIDGEERLRRYAAACARINGSAGDVFNLIRRAADADAELAQLWETNIGQRRAGVALVLDTVLADATLRRGLTRERAVDLLWTFHGPEMFHMLVTVNGWTIDEYESWLGSTLCEQLLGPTASTR